MVLSDRVPCNLRYFTHWLWHQLVIFACLCSYFWGPRGAFLSLLLLLHLLEFLCKEKLYFSSCFFLFDLLLLCTCMSISFPCTVSPSIVTSPFCPQIAQNLTGARGHILRVQNAFALGSHSHVSSLSLLVPQAFMQNSGWLRPGGQPSLGFRKVNWRVCHMHRIPVGLTARHLKAYLW